MNITSKIAALLVAIRKEDIEQLCPAERLRFAQLCQRAAILATPQEKKVQCAGVLYDLKDYRRDE